LRKGTRIDPEAPEPLEYEVAFMKVGGPTTMIFDIGIIPSWKVRTVSFGTL
jgi:hypothetical protein